MKITGIIRFALLLIIGVQLACSGENGSNPSEPPIIGSKEVSFSSPTSYSVGRGPADLTIADFDNDLIPDIATTNQRVGDVSILKGKGDGTFTPLDTVITNPSGLAIAAADFNNDGHSDFALSTQTGDAVSSYLGDGSGHFPVRHFYNFIGKNTHSLAIADYNADGFDDIAVTMTSGQVYLFSGIGDGVRRQSLGTFGPWI